MTPFTQSPQSRIPPALRAQFLFAALAAVLSAQSLPKAPAPAFCAVSIKLTSPRQGAAPLQTDPAGLHWHRATLDSLILQAYGIDEEQLRGGEEWTHTEYFSVDATTCRPATKEALFVMLRKAIEVRFKLRFAITTNTTSAFALTVGPSGPKFHALDNGDDTHYESEPPPGKMYTDESSTVAGLVWALNYPQPALGRILVDRTGLHGHYNLYLTVGYDEVTAADEPQLANFPHITSARRLRREDFKPALEALGFVIEPTTVKRDVYTIQSATKPTPN